MQQKLLLLEVPFPNTYFMFFATRHGSMNHHLSMHHVQFILLPLFRNQVYRMAKSAISLHVLMDS